VDRNPPTSCALAADKSPYFAKNPFRSMRNGFFFFLTNPEYPVDAFQQLSTIINNLSTLSTA
jgi:hypothetical protein